MSKSTALMAISASNSHSIGVLEARVIMLNIVLIFIVFRIGVQSTLYFLAGAFAVVLYRYCFVAVFPG